MKKMLVLLLFLLVITKDGLADKWIQIDNQLAYNSEAVQKSYVFGDKVIYLVEVRYFIKNKPHQAEDLRNEIWLIDIEKRRIWPLRFQSSGLEYYSMPLEAAGRLIKEVQNSNYVSTYVSLSADVEISFDKYGIIYWKGYEDTKGNITISAPQSFSDSKGTKWHILQGKLFLKQEYLSVEALQYWRINPSWQFYAIVNENYKKAWVIKKENLQNFQYIEISDEEFDVYFQDFLEKINEKK